MAECLIKKELYKEYYKKMLTKNIKCDMLLNRKSEIYIFYFSINEIFKYK